MQDPELGHVPDTASFPGLEPAPAPAICVCFFYNINPRKPSLSF